MFPLSYGRVMLGDGGDDKIRHMVVARLGAHGGLFPQEFLNGLRVQGVLGAPGESCGEGRSGWLVRASTGFGASFEN